MRRPIFLIVAVGLLVATGARAETPGPSRVRHLDQAFRALDDAYPTTRVVGGLVSMLPGGVSALGGFLLMIDRARPDADAIAGGVLLVAGGAAGLDGLIRTFRTSSPEMLVPHYQRFPMDGKPVAYGGDKDRVQFGEQTLERLADEGRRGRMLRGALDVVSAAAYWYLFAQGDKKIGAGGAQTGNKYYPYLVAPAAFLTAVAAYRFLFHSPEERAWNGYREAVARGGRLESSVQMDAFVAPLPEGAQAGLSVRF